MISLLVASLLVPQVIESPSMLLSEVCLLMLLFVAYLMSLFEVSLMMSLFVAILMMALSFGEADHSAVDGQSVEPLWHLAQT